MKDDFGVAEVSNTGFADWGLFIRVFGEFGERRKSTELELFMISYK